MDEKTTTTRHTSDITVRMKEVAYDHVYFGNFYAWFESARSDLSRAARMPYSRLEEQGVGSFVTRAGAVYRKPVFPHHRVQIESRIAALSRLRFGFRYDVFTDGDGTPAVSGYSEHATSDLATGKLVRVPQEFSAAYTSTDEGIEKQNLKGPEEIHFRHNLRARYEETDAMGIIYHGNYFTWMEAAWSGQLFGTSWDIGRGAADGRGIPVVEAHADFLAPCTYDEEIVVEVGVRRASRVRLQFDYRIRKACGDTVCVCGRTINAVMNKGRPVEAPTDLLDALGMNG